jgi:hypothetical protein
MWHGSPNAGVTLAMEARFTDHIWSLQELVGLLEQNIADHERITIA